MTNKPMLSVERELLQTIVSVHPSDRNYRIAKEELRAFLDKQSCGACGGCHNGCKLDRESPPIEPAAQHQGEPVAGMPVERCYDVRAKMIIAFNEAKKAGGDLDDALDAAYKSALRYSPHPMTAEQPAPVAEVVSTGGPHDKEDRVLVELQAELPPVGTKLYAEQGAPVAVVLPERREPDPCSPYLSDSDIEWNAAIDAVTRLNTPQ